jgi:hypothetical protein
MNEATRKREAERATQLITQLLHNYHLSSWSAGFCQGLLSHAPTQRQQEILDRIALQHGIGGEQATTTEQKEPNDYQPSRRQS